MRIKELIDKIKQLSSRTINDQDFSGSSNLKGYINFKKSSLAYLTILFLVVALGITVYQVQQRQQPRGKAATVVGEFQKVELDRDIREPMDLSIAPDGRVFYIERGGRVKIYYPSSGIIKVIRTFSVEFSNEDGLLGVALDPNFMSNKWIYFFYSPDQEANVQRISRFTLNSDDTINMSTEKILLKIPVERTVVVGVEKVGSSHSGGAIRFGPGGNLYIAVGDGTSYMGSDGYAPIDERPGHAIFDAQRSASNTNDLRGKILRIKPNDDGTYSIPPGNLYPQGTGGARSEIYAMGFRNPFRFTVDQTNGWLYVGNVGPQAPTDNLSRGPKQYDEVEQVRGPGNFGWPYCIANNKAYIDYNFAAKQSGATFNCASLVNDSPNRGSGLYNLPPAQPAWIYYPYGKSAEFPVFNQQANEGGRELLWWDLFTDLTRMLHPMVASLIPTTMFYLYMNGRVTL